MPRWLRRSPRSFALALLLLAAGAALAACGGSSTAARAEHGDDKLLSIFGGSSQLMAQPSSTLDTLRQLGVDMIRVDIRWSTLAPNPTSHRRPPLDASDPAAYPAASWAPYDQAIEAAAARGIGVDATIGGTVPLWAEGPGDPLQKGEPVGIWKPKPAAFGQFVRAVATRYDGHYKPAGATRPLPKVTFWSFWNEPNYGQDLAPQARHHSEIEVAPALYRGLLDAGWSALQATGHGRDTILFGETAPRGQTVGNVPGNFGLMKPLRFLRALYCVNASFQRLSGTAASQRGCPSTAAAAAAFVRRNPALFDAAGLAAHLYPQGTQRPAQRLPNQPDDADFASLPELEQTLDRSLAAYGRHRRLPIYDTEFGYHTDPPEPYSPSPATAAALMNEAEYLSWRNPRVKSYDQYLLQDAPGDSFATGLVSADGTPKATYAAFRMPVYLPRTTQPRRGRVEVWGCVRPAHFAPGPQHVQIQFAPGHGTAFTTLKRVALPDRTGYFDTTVAFPRSGTMRLAWRYPHGPEIVSRSVAVTVR